MAKAQESSYAVPLLESLRERGFRAEIAVMDMGYDLGPVYEGFEARGCHPVIPLRETPAVKAGKHRPPTCEHGEWTFAGSDAKRRAAKWRCPTGECSPASTWVGASRLRTLIPRGTARWQKLYRLRGAVERENGRLKNEWALLPLRVRHRAGRAARRPDHPGPAGDGAGQGPNLGDPYPPRTTTLGVAACLGPQQPAALSAGKDHADRCGAAILGPYPHLRINRPKLAEELTMTRRLGSSFASRIAGPS